MSLTIAQDRAEILSRPSFRFYENLISNKVGAAILQAQQTANRVLYNANRLTDRHYQKNLIAAGLALPTGVAWGTTANIYKWNAGSTPVLTTDLVRLSKLWVKHSTGTVTYSKSGYDSDASEGSGLPDDGTAIAIGDVYHEFNGEGTSAELILLAGTSALDATGKLEIIYTRTLTLPAADSDLIDAPDSMLYSTWDSLRNQYLDFYIGFHQ